MGIGRRLKEAREKAGLTQDALGKLVGVTGSSITNYEKETSHPKEPIMYALINALGVDANFLFQDCVNTKPAAKNKPTTPEPYVAEVVATKYKRLDRHGKQVVCAVITEEEKRIDSEYQWQEPKAVYSLCDYLQTASVLSFSNTEGITIGFVETRFNN